MFRLHYLRRAFRAFRYVTLEEAIERHITSSGTGFELDDVVSSGHYPEAAVSKIVAISSKYRTPEYPVGIVNPDSYDELKKVAEEFK